MQHTARDLLQEELSKLTRWQVALIDKTGAVYKKVESFEKDMKKVMEVFITVTGSGGGLFMKWEEVNNAIAEGKAPPEEALKFIDTFNKMTVGNDSGKANGGVGAAGINTRSHTGRLITQELEDWMWLKQLVLDDQFNGTYIKQLDIHHLPNWLDNLYDEALEGSGARSVAEIRTAIKEIEDAVSEFETRSKKFFDAVPEGTDKMYEKGNKANETAFAKRLLGLGGKENDANISMSSLRNGSRSAIRAAMEYQRSLLKMFQTMMAAGAEAADLVTHFTKLLHQVGQAAINDFKAANQPVPDDLAEAVKALSPSGLKSA